MPGGNRKSATLIVTDLSMPVMNYLLKKLMPAVPAIFSTGQCDPFVDSVRREASPAGWHICGNVQIWAVAVLISKVWSLLDEMAA
jgi:hypothetical protein